MNEVAISMLKTKYPMSNALKQKRKKNFGTGEDYGTKLPDDEVNAIRAKKLEDSDDDVIIGDAEEQPKN